MFAGAGLAIKAFAKGAWAFLKGIPLWVYAAIAAVLIGWYAFNAHGDKRYEAGKTEVQLQFDAFKADLEEQRRLAREAAAKAEGAMQEAESTALTELREDTNETIAEKDRIIAAIRSDNLRLQDRFRHQAASGVPTNPANSAGDNGTRECGLRKSDEEFFISFSADADRVVHKLTACQAKLDAIERNANGGDN